ncbi:MAG: hypothetical protein ACRC4H_06235 [Plesiomonas sp.]
MTDLQVAQRVDIKAVVTGGDADTVFFRLDDAVSDPTVVFSIPRELIQNHIERVARNEEAAFVAEEREGDTPF